jgi:hypothetical protein
VVPVKAIRALHSVLDDKSLHQVQLCLVWQRRRSVGGRRKREFAKRTQRERRLNGFASESRTKKRLGLRRRNNVVGKKRRLV